MTVAASAQPTVTGGFGLDTGTPPSLSSMRSPSRRRSKTKSISVAAAGTAGAMAASASRDQISARPPNVCQNACEQHGGAAPRLGTLAAARGRPRPQRRPRPASGAGTRTSRLFLTRARLCSRRREPAVDRHHRHRRSGRRTSGRLSPAQGAPPQRRRWPVRGGERTRGAPAAGQRPARVVGAGDRAAAGDAGRRARRFDPVPRLPGVAGDAGCDRGLSRPSWLPGHRRAPAAGVRAARRARRGRARRSRPTSTTWGRWPATPPRSAPTR